jgi:hypothetical protein
VPVIVNAVLNEHHLVTDIVAFVSKGDFHRSRLGEKQRGKILAGWVTRKMRTIAQFSIRDPEGADSQITEVAEPGMGVSGGRTSTGTFKNSGPRPGSVKGSLKREGSTLGLTNQMQTLQMQQTPMQMHISLPTGISEMPAQNYANSIPELATESMRDERERGGDDTPTEARREFPTQVRNDGALSYSPIDVRGVFDDDSQDHHNQQDGNSGIGIGSLPLPPSQDPDAAPPQPSYGNKPFLNLPSTIAGSEKSLHENDRRSLPSQQQSRGGLRVANRTSMAEDSEDDWPREAIMQMNFAGDGPESMGRFY